MIYLYDADKTDFKYNGMPLSKSYEVVVKQLLNDEFYVTGKHPIDIGKTYKEIKEDKIIKVHTPKGMQPFRLVTTKKYMNYIEYEAWPLLYADLRNKAIKPLELVGVNGQDVLNAFSENLLLKMPFSFSSSITKRHDYHTQDVNERENNSHQLYDALEVLKAIINRWEGELVIDGYDIRMIDRIGSNKDVLIYEKKNINDFLDTESVDSIVTRAHGISQWTDDKNIDHTIQVTVDSPLIDEYSGGIIFEKQYINNNAKTESELKSWLNLKFSNENIDKPKRNIELSTNRIDDEDIHMGDGLVIKYIKHDVDMSIRMIGYEYDGFDNQYLKTYLGDAKETFSTSLTNNYSTIENNVRQIVDDATHVITNSLGQKVAYGLNEPVGQFKSGDIWFELNGETTTINQYTGTKWDPIIIEGSTVTNIAADSITTGTFNGEKLNIIGITTQDITGLNSQFIQTMWNGINSNAHINGQRLRFGHNDGTSTEIGVNGIRRVTPSDNRNYHYLFYATTFIYGESSSNARWIQLPNDYKGKDFKVFFAIADSMNAPSYKYAIQRFVCTVHPDHDIDYKNARVPVISYKSNTLMDGNEPVIDNVQGLLFAIY